MCVSVCIHTYPVSTEMTSVLNVQSLKLILPPSLPLSVFRYKVTTGSRQ